MYPVSHLLYPLPVLYYSHCILYPSPPISLPGLYPIIHIVSCIPPPLPFTRPALFTLNPVSTTFTSYIFYMACILLFTIVSCIPPSISFTRPVLFTLDPISFTWPVSYYSHCILYPSPPISLPGLYFESCILYSLTYLSYSPDPHFSITNFNAAETGFVLLSYCTLHRQKTVILYNRDSQRFNIHYDNIYI